MVTDLQQSITDETLASIVEQVWESLFRFPPMPADPGDWSWTDPAVAEVDIHGAWTASVSVTCSTATATALTRCMMAATHHMSAEHVDDEDIADAMGELVNVVGGNLKSLLEGCALGLPRYRRDGRGPLQGDVIALQAVDWNGEPVHLAVHHHRGGFPADHPASDHATPTSQEQS